MAEVKVNGTKYLDFVEELPGNPMKALSKIYYLFYDVSLEDDSFVKYHASRLVSDYTDRFVSAHDCLQACAKVMYVPEHQKLLADFYDTAAWPERLKEKDTEYVNARGVQNGWIRTNLIVAVRDENGVPTHVFVAIQNVNEIMLKDIEQTKQLEVQVEEISALNAQLEDNQAELEAQVEEISALNAQLEENQAELEAQVEEISALNAQLEENQAELEAQMEEISALNTQLEENQAELEASLTEQESQLQEINSLNSEMLLILNSMADTYYSMHLINLEENTAVNYKSGDEVWEIINDPQGVAHMMENVITVVVADEYRDAALTFTDLTTLRERMGNRKVLTSEFVCKRIGWAKASFISVRSDRNGMPVEVMFVTRSIDQEKKKEEGLIRTSNTDALTKLLNRRAYETEINITDGVPEDLVFIAFDVNELKRVNDLMGHAAGDELLIGAADCMRKGFGKYGKIYRIGGDEFAAILHIRMDELEKAGNEFRKFVSDWSGKLVDQMHIAMGYSIAAEDKDCGSIHRMSILADKRMYEDKAEYYKQSGADRRKR